MKLLVVVEAVEDLLLGFVADGAGVVEDQAGLFFGFDLPVSLMQQCANDLFGVMGIHLAAESLKVEGFFGRHNKFEYRAFPCSESPTAKPAGFAVWGEERRPIANNLERKRTVFHGTADDLEH